PGEARRGVTDRGVEAGVERTGADGAAGDRRLVDHARVAHSVLIRHGDDRGRAGREQAEHAPELQRAVRAHDLGPGFAVVDGLRARGVLAAVAVDAVHAAREERVDVHRRADLPAQAEADLRPDEAGADVRHRDRLVSLISRLLIVHDAAADELLAVAE